MANTVSRWGNSLAVRIPKALAEQVGLREGTAIEMTMVDGALVVPALVLSARRYNEPAGLAVMCPITSKAKGYPFEVALSAEGPVQGVVLADHIKSLDWRARKATFIAASEAAVIAEVRARLRPLLGLG